MPTTLNEADMIVATILEHVSPEAAAQLATKLRERVGERTDNSSVRDTMLMISEAVARITQPPPLSWTQWLLIRGINAAHWLVIAGNIVSAASLVFYGLAGWHARAWMVAFPLVTFTVWTITSRNYDCPLTKLEDLVRARYRQPLVKAFLAYFVVKPYRQWRQRREDP